MRRLEQVGYVLRRILRYRMRLLHFVFSSLGTAAFMGLPILLVHQFLGAMLDTRDFPLILQLSWVMFAVYVIMGYFTARREVATRYLADRLTTDLVNEAAGALLARPLSYFGDMRTGEIVSRMMTDAQFAGQAALLLLLLIREPLTIVAVVAAAVYLDWRLALIGFIGFPLAVLPLVALGNRIRRASQRARELTADLSDSLVQRFSGIKVVKALNLEAAAAADIVRNANGIFEQNMKTARAAALTRPIVEIVNGLGMVAVVLVGGYMVVSGALNQKELITFVVALVALHKPTRSLTASYNQLRYVLPGLERLRELTAADGGRPDGSHEAAALREGICFERVSFAYGREQVLDDVNLKIPAGKFIAIVGPTGAGKTTLLDLIMRFYRPTSGSVMYDGRPLNELRHASLLARLSYAPQNAVLFNVSIRENVRLGRPGASDQEVEEACRLAGVHDEILRFQKGYVTEAGEGGGALSGGQRQRVALARAMIREADVYIFDEPAGALDAASEAALYERLLARLAGRTLILVTHRLAILERADSIVVISGGHIEATGKHAELLQTSATYHSLHQHAFAAGQREARLS